jgi:hypothetical protein
MPSMSVGKHPSGSPQDFPWKNIKTRCKYKRVSMQGKRRRYQGLLVLELVLELKLEFATKDVWGDCNTGSSSESSITMKGPMHWSIISSRR